MNPDGYEIAKNSKRDEKDRCTGLHGRANADGVDLNR